MEDRTAGPVSGGKASIKQAQQGPNRGPTKSRRGLTPGTAAHWRWTSGEGMIELYLFVLVIKLLLGAVFHRQHQLFFSPFFLGLCLCSFGRTGSANIHSFSPSPR